jgi:Asp-tRNA(Asn)/Glu-tRNA(Gln) amidotransferase A subunit family amidase
MSPTRRDVLSQLATLTAMAALPRSFGGFDSPDPLSGTIAEYQAGLRRKKWTAVEVTAMALERCRTRGAELHAIDALAETALGDARDSDLRRKNGRAIGPMDGVPVFAKAIYDVNGLPTTGSNAEWARLFPEAVHRDALEVARFRAAGAIVLGKTAADDFAYNGRGTSSLTGQVVNPHDPTGTRSPGGSSAGSAIAVLTGLAFVGLGTDDGGSNRIPAQWSGVVGMKPSFGLVPRTGVIPTWPYLDTHGPLARNVADAAFALAALAGPDGSDPLALTARWNGTALAQLRDDALNGVRIGVVEANIPRDKMTVEAIALWERAVSDVTAAGGIVEAFESPVTARNYRDAFAAAAKERGDVEVNDNSPGPTANALYRYFAGRSEDPRDMVRRGYDAYRSYYDVLPEHFEDCEPLFTQPMEQDPAGQSFARSRATVVNNLTQAMRAAGISAMIWPTMPFNALHLGEKWPAVPTTLSYNNWLGLPEVSVPAGIGADSMPAMNLSVVGFPGDDARVLALAHAYERQSKRLVAR